MGRKPLDIKPQTLQDAINSAEANGALANLSVLWNTVGTNLGISSTSIKNLVEKNNLTYQTKAGAKGRVAGQGMPAATNRVSRAVKYGTTAGRKHINAVRQAIPGRDKLVDRLAKGSMKAAIRLMCIDCTCGMVGEITNCPIISCPLWNFRPKTGLVGSSLLEKETNESV